MQGIKRKRRCEIECKDHILAIQSLKANSSKYDIKLLFCPKFQRQPLPPEHTYPEYNNDGKFYTSAFILGVDRRVLIKNEQQELMDHQKQIRDSLEKHNQLIFPRPNSKHSLCSVCKEHYKNYYYHISSEEHREKIAQSQYNIHIKELCNIYVDQWQGAEERADQEAQRRAVQEEERRQQLAEMTVQENQEEEESLLDVQRGEQEDNDDDEDADATYNAKPAKKYIKNNFKDDDTIPFTARTNKRSAPEGRVYTSEYLRKKFLFNNPVASQDRAHREREQRRYERERDKLKTERDNPQNPKEFIKINEKEGDTFIIMKAAHAIAHTQGEFVWKRTSDKLRKELERNQQKGEKSIQKMDLTPEKYEKENKKYQIDYGMEQKFMREDKEGDKMEIRPYAYYPYPHMPPYAMNDFKPEQKQGEHYKADTKGQDQKYEGYKNIEKSEGRSSHPYYYNPYVYPPVYEPYHRTENTYQYNERQKGKKGEKGYEYPPMPYWPYPPPPYYIPPMQPPQHTEQSTPSSKSTNSNASSNPYTSTSININFPMYMCPPPHHISNSPYPLPARYSAPPMPHPHYMPYQYPYGPNQPSGRQEEYVPNASNPLPKISSNHLSSPIVHQPQPGHSSHPHAQGYRNYPPYMTQHAHYQSPHQHQQAQSSSIISK